MDVERGGGSDFHHFKIFLAHTAIRADPVIGDVVPLGAGLDALFRQTFFFIMLPISMGFLMIE